MYHRTLTYGFLLFLLLAGGANCTADDVRETAPLERKLLIGWVATERGDREVTERFNREAQADWQRLVKKYRKTILTRNEAHSVGRLDRWMSALDDQTGRGARQSARMYYDLILNEIRTLRPRYDLHHPADRLYDFYYDWERVVEVSNDQMMCLLEWGEFRELCNGATGSWTSYRQTSPGHHYDLFPGLGNNSTRSEAAGRELTLALDEFDRLLQLADHTRTVAPAERIRHQFFDYLAVILDYPGEPINP